MGALVVEFWVKSALRWLLSVETPEKLSSGSGSRLLGDSASAEEGAVDTGVARG